MLRWVEWQVTLCDSMWQVTLLSSVTPLTLFLMENDSSPFRQQKVHTYSAYVGCVAITARQSCKDYDKTKLPFLYAKFFGIAGSAIARFINLTKLS